MSSASIRTAASTAVSTEILLGQWNNGIRQLAPAHHLDFQAHLLRLGSDCRRSRFGNPTSDRFLQDYVDRLDFANTRVFGCFIDGHMRGAAELRSLQSQWCGEAEVAFSVEAAWQSRGIGTVLMAQMILAAHALGVGRLYLSCHAFNRRMQRIAERFAAKMSFEDCECFADITVDYQPIAPVLLEAGTAAGAGTNDIMSLTL